MKCGYNNCKLGGNVEKESAVKDGSRYYHLECNEKKHIKSECANKLKQYGMMAKTVNSFLKNMIDDDDIINNNYLLFVINYVVDNKLKLNNPYGIKYYLANYKIEKLYEEKVKAEVLKDFKDMSSCETVTPTSFNNKKTTPKYLKIL